MKKKLHVALIEASVAHRKRSRSLFQSQNLSDGQPKVLAYLLAGEGMLQKDLATRCGVEPATMTQLLKKMMQDDLIVKNATHVSGGKRAFQIILTDHGREMAQKAIDIVDDVEEMGFAGFTQDEKETLVELLSRMAENLKK